MAKHYHSNFGNKTITQRSVWNKNIEALSNKTKGKEPCRSITHPIYTLNPKLVIDTTPSAHRIHSDAISHEQRQYIPNYK